MKAEGRHEGMAHVIVSSHLNITATELGQKYRKQMDQWQLIQVHLTETM